jgi:anti-anti-sigma factor
MSEHVKIHYKDEGYVVIELTGRFVPSGENDTASEIKKTFSDLCASGHKKIMLDLRNVDFFASNAIGALMSGYNIVATANGKMVLWRPKKYLADSLRLVRVDKLLTIVDTLDAALKVLGIEIKEE